MKSSPPHVHLRIRSFVSNILTSFLFLRMTRFQMNIANLWWTMWSLCTSVWGNIARSSCRSCEESTTSHQRTTSTSSAHILNCWIRRTSLFMTSARGWKEDWISSWRLQSRSRCWMNSWRCRKWLSQRSQKHAIFCWRISPKNKGLERRNEQWHRYVHIICRRALSSCCTNTFHYCSMSLTYRCKRVCMSPMHIIHNCCLHRLCTFPTFPIITTTKSNAFMVLFSSWANHETSLSFTLSISFILHWLTLTLVSSSQVWYHCTILLEVIVCKNNHSLYSLFCRQKVWKLKSRTRW